jgi:leucyl aminopeptidase
MMLKINLAYWKKWKGEGQTLAVFTFEGNVPEEAKADGFKGKELETFIYRPKDAKPAGRVLLIGLGKRAEFTGDVLRRAASKVIRGAENVGLKQIAVRLPNPQIQALAEGLYLASYRFDKHRKLPEDAPPPVEEVTIWVNGVSAAVKAVVEKARLEIQATMLARDLVNEPPSRMDPERLAAEALKLNKVPVSVTVYEKKDLEKMGMGAILGVGAGSAVPPRLVELLYKPAKRARKVVAIVGKGITFDSGGLSLKQAQPMETMKDDMSGAAAVLAVFSVLAELKPAVEVRGYLAIAENMPGGRAQKPGDVLKTFSGKTVEVLNTDAEGRLVLADALAYAASKKPDVLIDVATLTGACVVALGHLVSAVMGNRRDLIQAVLRAGTQTGERFWELPLVKEYRDDIKSKIADIKNIGGRRGEAGTIIGGLFLREFVGDAPWAHLDIAGASWTDSDTPLCPTGGTGHPVRTLLRYLESI